MIAILYLSGQAQPLFTVLVTKEPPFSQKAEKLSRDVILHVPMEAISGKALGPGALTSDMDKRALQSQLMSILDDYPKVIGINNHMGSAFTEDLEGKFCENCKSISESRHIDFVLFDKSIFAISNSLFSKNYKSNSQLYNST